MRRNLRTRLGKRPRIGERLFEDVEDVVVLEEEVVGEEGVEDGDVVVDEDFKVVWYGDAGLDLLLSSHERKTLVAVRELMGITGVYGDENRLAY
jgi:hypothetical protein